MQAGENNTQMPQIQAMWHNNGGPERKTTPTSDQTKPNPKYVSIALSFLGLW